MTRRPSDRRRTRIIAGGIAALALLSGSAFAQDAFAQDAGAQDAGVQSDHPSGDRDNSDTRNAPPRLEPQDGMVRVPKPVDPGMTRPAPAMPPQSMPVIKPHHVPDPARGDQVTVEPR